MAQQTINSTDPIEPTGRTKINEMFTELYAWLNAKVTAAMGIGSNNNDTTYPTSAAVKAYVDAAIASAGGGAIAYAALNGNTVNSDFPLTQGVVSGSQFTVQSNNIKCNFAGYVKVTGEVQGSDWTGQNIYIYKNGSEVRGNRFDYSKDESDVLYPVVPIFWVGQVAINDVISLRVNGNTQSQGGNDMNGTLIVQKI